MPILLNLKLGIILAAAMVLLLSGTYFYGRWDGSAACDARHEKAAMDDYIKRTEEAAILSASLEDQLLNSRNFYIDLERQVQNEIASNPIYRNCVLPANGLYLVNSAIAGKPSR